PSHLAWQLLERLPKPLLPLATQQRSQGIEVAHDEDRDGRKRPLLRICRRYHIDRDLLAKPFRRAPSPDLVSIYVQEDLKEPGVEGRITPKCFYSMKDTQHRFLG